MINFFHKLFNPHCEHCLELEKENRRDPLIEHLELEISLLRQENSKLLFELLNSKITKTEIKEESKVDNQSLQIITNRQRRWPQIQKELERNSRQEAALLKQNAKNVEEFEKLLVSEKEEEDAIQQGNV